MGRIEIDSKAAADPGVQRSLEKLARELGNELGRVDSLLAQVEDLWIPDIGIPFPWFAGTVPSWALLLDGSTKTRATYQALFDLWGTTFNTGGEAGTDFRLPDARNRVLIGQGASGTFATLAATGGVEEVTITVAQMPSHGHVLNVGPAGLGGQAAAPANDETGTLGGAINEEGGDDPHTNLQPYLVIKGWIVRAL